MKRKLACRQLGHLRLVSRTVSKAASDKLFKDIDKSCSATGIMDLLNLATSRHAHLIESVSILAPLSQVRPEDRREAMIAASSLDDTKQTAGSSATLTLARALHKLSSLKFLVIDQCPQLRAQRHRLVGLQLSRFCNLFEQIQCVGLTTLEITLNNMVDFDHLLFNVRKKGKKAATWQVSEALQNFFDRLTSLTLDSNGDRREKDESCNVSKQESRSPGYAMLFIASIARNVQRLTIMADDDINVPKQVILASGGRLIELSITECDIQTDDLTRLVRTNLNTIDNLGEFCNQTGQRLCRAKAFLQLLTKAPQLEGISEGLVLNLLELTGSGRSTWETTESDSSEAEPSTPDSLPRSKTSPISEAMRSAATKPIKHLNENRSKRNLELYNDEWYEENKYREDDVYEDDFVDDYGLDAYEYQYGWSDDEDRYMYMDDDF